MRDFLEAAVREAKRRGADYAEARYVLDERDEMAVRDGDVERAARSSSEGVGVRVLFRGAWGFASRPRGEAADVDAALGDALAVARAAATLVRRPIRLADEAPQRGSYRTPLLADPFAVPPDEKLHLLAEAEAALRQHTGASHRTSQAHTSARRQKKELATSDGTAVDQELVYTGAGLRLTVGDDAIVQHRSFPMDLDGGVRAAGFEYVRALDLPGQAVRIADDALGLLRAPPCPVGRRALIVAPSQLALQIHESCGHPTECDRALGEELSLAGGSFLAPGGLGHFRYGAPNIFLTADSTTPGGLGTFGWDDEGTPARRTPLVEAGIHVGYLSSRETAARLGLSRSGGTVRAENHAAVPIIRMVNVSLEPDPRGPSLDEMIADTDDGVLVAVNRSWSIDDLRLNFQFGCEMAWEVKRGRRTRLLRDALYTGITPAFWSSCDAVGRPDELELFGLTSCGKGDPMQVMAVSHGCPPARFRNVEIGAR